MAGYVGAIDQGTTGTRFMLIDHDGRVAAAAYETHEQYYPEPGWVEHDPIEIWENTKTVIHHALDDGGIAPADVVAIGVTNQRETTIVWDAATGAPVHNAIVWQDRRTTGRVEDRIQAGDDAWIRRRTGLAIDAYFSATKLEWLLGTIDATRAAHGDLVFGTVDTWLIYKLTGAHVTDVTNASRTMLFDIHDLAWDEELCEEFGVPTAMLPAVRPSSDPDPYGYTDPDDVGAEIPVTAAVGDQQAALFGQTCFTAGEAKNTYGTGSFLLMNTGPNAVESDHGLLTTVAFQAADAPTTYALEGSIFVTGAAIEWLTDIGLIDDAAETEQLARAVDATNDVYFVPAFTGLGAPHWDGRARGLLIGITRGTRREHIVRAALESTAFQTRDVLEAMAADSDIAIATLRVDGGAVANDVLCQFQADLVGVDVVRPAVDETTALGAAYAAGLAVGYWETLDELRANWHTDRRFTASLDPAEATDQYRRWAEAVERSRDWAHE